MPLVAFLEAQHEEAQCTQCIIRDAIVHAHPEPADTVVACELEQSCSLGLFNEAGFQYDVSSLNPERHTGPRAVLRCDIVGVEPAGAVQDTVELHSQ